MSLDPLDCKLAIGDCYPLARTNATFSTHLPAEFACHSPHRSRQSGKASPYLADPGRPQQALPPPSAVTASGHHGAHMDGDLHPQRPCQNLAGLRFGTDGESQFRDPHSDRKPVRLCSETRRCDLKRDVMLCHLNALQAAT
ncbi:hypothetical protein SV7mr_40000 [Stieleria bergensis]|uniref:Uncharacterized protein n=1 Tax=Stieleria bergensis TaxID=2528025 RepID=A0A517SZ90_9BACT|nr:hypothetical protein SV7mr_40000 [Planctomycetes bacterium SV_7m_r]